mmetsp:Transcript_7277/g.17494  ORF Transcript_7277/g.17494 Transcript_7277/m.17494 type:complete len:221 (+) Transcript_7277:1617-2279(+)
MAKCAPLHLRRVATRLHLLPQDKPLPQDSPHQNRHHRVWHAAVQAAAPALRSSCTLPLAEEFHQAALAVNLREARRAQNHHPTHLQAQDQHGSLEMPHLFWIPQRLISGSLHSEHSVLVQVLADVRPTAGFQTGFAGMACAQFVALRVAAKRTHELAVTAHTQWCCFLPTVAERREPFHADLQLNFSPGQCLAAENLHLFLGSLLRSFSSLLLLGLPFAA